MEKKFFLLAGFSILIIFSLSYTWEFHVEDSYIRLFEDSPPPENRQMKWHFIALQTFFGALAIVIPLLIFRKLELRRKKLESDVAVFNKIIELSGKGLVICGMDGVIAHANQAFIKTIDRSNSELACHPNIFDYYPGQLRQRVKTEIIPAVLKKRLWTGEMQMLSPDGASVPVIESIFPVNDEYGNFLYLVRLITDISEQKKSEQMLKQLSIGIIEAQENERRRVSSELHDSLAQNLLVINSEIQKIIESERRKGERVSAWKRAGTLAQETMEQVTDIAFDLRPPSLDKLGFEKTIAQLAGRISESTDISIFVEIDQGDTSMPKEVEISAYRMIQEAFNNVIKHSKATEAYVDVTCRKNLIEINISDNGAGFDYGLIASREESRTGKGLLGIEERVRIFGGSFTIDSEIGGGSTLSIIFPFDQKDKSQQPMDLGTSKLKAQRHEGNGSDRGRSPHFPTRTFEHNKK